MAVKSPFLDLGWMYLSTSYDARRTTLSGTTFLGPSGSAQYLGVVHEHGRVLLQHCLIDQRNQRQHLGIPIPQGFCKTRRGQDKRQTFAFLESAKQSLDSRLRLVSCSNSRPRREASSNRTLVVTDAPLDLPSKGHRLARYSRWHCMASPTSAAVANTNTLRD